MKRTYSQPFVWAVIPSAVVVFGGFLYMTMMFGLTQHNWLGLVYWLIPLGVITYLVSVIALFAGSLLIKNRHVN